MSGIALALAALMGKKAPGNVSLPATIDAAINMAGTSSVTLENDGDWTSTNEPGSEWVTPSDAGVAANYEGRASNAVGDTADAVGTFNTWQALSTTRTWGVTGTNKLLTFTLEIREAVSGIVRDSTAVTTGTAA